MELLHGREIRLKQATLCRKLYEENLSADVLMAYTDIIHQDIITYVCQAEDCFSPYKLLFEYEHGMTEKEGNVEQLAQCIEDGRCSHTDREMKVLGCHLVHLAAINDKHLPTLRTLCEKYSCDINIETSNQDKHTPLCISVRNNQIETVRYLLSREEVDLNKGHQSPLCIAIQLKQKEIFHLLIQEKKIDLNWKDVYDVPLLTYCVRVYPKFVEPLLEAGACPNIASSNGDTPLMKAVTYQNQEVAKLLIKFGANINQKTRAGETVLLVAVYREDTEMCRILLEAGADPNFQTQSDGNSLLLLSAYDGCLEIIQLLIKYGGDAAQANNIEYTPLHIAAWNGHLDCVKEFLAAGVPYDGQTTDKNTPLALAAHGGHLDILEALLPLNCNVNNVDKDSDTALHYAAYNGLTRACELLLAHGADPDMCNQVNTTPLWNAVYKSKKDVVKLLLFANVKLEVCSRGIDQHAMTDDVVFVYDEPKSPLWVAVTNNSPAIVLLLISAGYDLHRERWLMEGEYPGDRESGIFNILTQYATTPPRLVSRCRNFLRGHFGRDVVEKVKSLPIPETLKSYLTLSDLL